MLSWPVFLKKFQGCVHCQAVFALAGFFTVTIGFFCDTHMVERSLSHFIMRVQRMQVLPSSW